MPGRWLTSTLLLRPSAGPEPVLGYRVAETKVTAQWPASKSGSRFEAQLIHRPRTSGKSAVVGDSLTIGQLVEPDGRRSPHAVVRASILIPDTLVEGQVQVRWRKVSPAADSMPGAWATSPGSFRCLRAPSRGTGQGEGAAQLLFFDENRREGHGDPAGIEVFICASKGDIAHPLFSAMRSGARVLFDVPPHLLSTPGLWLHARVVGQDEQCISSMFRSEAL
jgi:hypothetical protein